jgi:hypothetical protein
LRVLTHTLNSDVIDKRCGYDYWVDHITNHIALEEM